jgi:hypothetical protein
LIEEKSKNRMSLLSFLFKQSSGDQPSLKLGWREARIPEVKSESGSRLRESRLRLRLKKRTSINSIPRIYKEKEMADFRKWFYALAVVALFAGLSTPASAQGTGTSAVTCNNGGATTPIVRAEGLTELMGDLVLNCTGGPATPANQVVPQVNITIILSVNITSKLTASNLYNEALLIIDEPNQAAPGPNSNRPILNCGQTGAPDTSTESGPGVCSIVSDGNPATTYNGVPNKNGTAAPCNVFGCGSPNVFQGRQGNPFNTGLINNISFLNVPFDPPGTGTSRTLRFTNIRGNANQDQIASTFIQVPITAQVAINGNQSFGINVPAQGQVVAFVQRGLITTVIKTRLDFVQCNTENGALAAGRGGTVTVNCGGSTGGGCNGPGPNFTTTPTVRFQEGFASAWKVRNVSEILTNGTFVSGNSYQYNGLTNNPADLNQNVPGTSYNTEAGFQYGGTNTPAPGSVPPSPGGNPPQGFGSGATGALNTGFPLANAQPTSTGISQAGIATQGTRLFLSFSNVPTGSAVFVAPVIYFYRQNLGTVPTPAVFSAGVSTGVAVLTNTDAAGDTAYAAVTTSTTALQPVSNGLAVYEVLFEDPGSLEQVDVPVVVAFVANLSANPPVGLPVTGQIAQVTGGFAPFYTSSAAALPATTTAFPIPRFVPGNAPLNLFAIVKCACDMLFPFVASAGGFDTGIAIANTSLDPGATFGFGATPQQGAVTFFYFGIGAGGVAPPASQTSGIVPAGQVLTYVLSSGGGGIGNNANGMDNRASGFQGYIIAQAGFQYCHSFAFISALGGGPTSAGVSEGYLGLILDPGGLIRTNQASENLVH